MAVGVQQPSLRHMSCAEAESPLQAQSPLCSLPPVVDLSAYLIDRVMATLPRPAWASVLPIAELQHVQAKNQFTLTAKAMLRHYKLLVVPMNTDRKQYRGHGTHWRTLWFRCTDNANPHWQMILADPAGCRSGGGWSNTERALRRAFKQLADEDQGNEELYHMEEDHPPLAVRGWAQRKDNTCGAVAVAVARHALGPLQGNVMAVDTECGGGPCPDKVLDQVRSLLLKARADIDERMQAEKFPVEDKDGVVVID